MTGRLRRRIRLRSSDPNDLIIIGANEITILSGGSELAIQSRCEHRLPDCGHLSSIDKARISPLKRPVNGCSGG